MDINWLELIKHERRLEDNQRYGAVAKDWQIALDQALLTNPRVYLELPRGHDKTGRFACHALCWLLEGEGKHAYAAGVDKDNAKLFRNDMRDQARRSSAIFGDIEFYNYMVENRRNGNTLEILSSDAPSNIGLKFSLLLINDFVDWKSREFFEVLISATGKIPNVKVWIESNAGRSKKGYKWDMREHARTAGRWYFKSTKSWLATWTAKEWFDDMRRILTPAGYRRLIGNEWIEGEDSFLTDDQVSDAILPDLTPALVRPEKAILVATSTDLGITKDAAAVGTVARMEGEGNSPGKERILDLVVFPGSQTDPVRISAVEGEIQSQHDRFRSDGIIVDPWNMKKTIQDHEAVWPIEEFTFTPQNIMNLTTDVFHRIIDRTLELYPNAGWATQRGKDWNLELELTTAIIKQMSYGERIDHKKSGYTDRIITIGMALWWLGQNSLPPARREFSVRVI